MCFPSNNSRRAIWRPSQTGKRDNNDATDARGFTRPSAHSSTPLIPRVNDSICQLSGICSGERSQEFVGFSQKCGSTNDGKNRENKYNMNNEYSKNMHSTLCRKRVVCVHGIATPLLLIVQTGDVYSEPHLTDLDDSAGYHRVTSIRLHAFLETHPWNEIKTPDLYELVFYKLFLMPNWKKNADLKKSRYMAEACCWYQSVACETCWVPRNGWWSPIEFFSPIFFLCALNSAVYAGMSEILNW